jgi:GNAT superfamily N-acetyltransferase
MTPGRKRLAAARHARHEPPALPESAKAAGGTIYRCHARKVHRRCKESADAELRTSNICPGVSRSSSRPARVCAPRLHSLHACVSDSGYLRSRLQVRHVTSEESERLRALRLRALASDPEAFGGTYAEAQSRPPEEWRQRAALSEDGASQRTFVVSDEGDRWLGMALVRLREEGPGLAGLNAMWVAPEARGRGAAKLLGDACAAWAAQQGCAELTLGIFAGNIRARRAYEAAGFVFTHDMMWNRPDGTTVGVQRMSRRLP